MMNKADILDAGILNVDDLEFNIHVLDRLLRNAGYTSVAASSIFLTAATDLASMGMLLSLAKVLVK